MKGFYHIWVCGHRGHVTWIIIHIHFCNLALIGQVVSEEKIFDIVDGWMDDGRMADGYTISSPCSNCQKKKKKRVKNQSEENILTTCTPSNHGEDTC